MPLARRPVGKLHRFGRKATIRVKDGGYDKEKVRVRRGAVVRWRFQGYGLHDVTVASGPRGFSSPHYGNGKVFRQKLTVPGTYRIYCTLHARRMVGQIRVGRK